MRHRRAERCRLRAEVAIDAGFFDDAREALDEARRLQPDLDGLADSEQRLMDAQFGRRDAPRVGRRGRRRVVAAAAIPLAIGCGWWVIANDQAVSSRPAPRVVAALEGAANIPQVIAPAPTAPNDLAEDDKSSPTAPGADPTPERAPRGSDAASKAAPTEAEVTTSPAIVMPAPEPPGASPGGDAPPLPVVQVSAPAEWTLTPVPPLATSLPAVAAPAAVETSGAAPASAAPGPGAISEVNPEMQVRGALARYEAAYSTLNAAAARDVWPSVDAAALARAFDSLESQRVSLGSCAIGVAADGRSARATCAGTATWTPKVGGGTATQARNWLFDLARNGSDWQIVSSTVR